MDSLVKLSQLKKHQLNKVLRLIDKLYNKAEANDVSDIEVDDDTTEVVSVKSAKNKNIPKTTTRTNTRDTFSRGESVGEQLRKRLKNSHKINRFDSMPEKKQNKEDTKIDKLLWKGKTPHERPPKVEFVNATCDSCGKTELVSPSFVYFDGEETKYKCNKCAASNKKNKKG